MTPVFIGFKRRLVMKTLIANPVWAVISGLVIWMVFAEKPGEWQRKEWVCSRGE